MRDLVRELCSPACAGRAPGTPGGLRARGHARDDLSTLRSFADLVEPLAAMSPLAETARARARELMAQCDARGRLPHALASAPSELVLGLENALA